MKTDVVMSQQFRIHNAPDTHTGTLWHLSCIRARQPLRACLVILSVLFITLLGINPCHAGTGGVVDDGGFFSERAKSDATKAIVEMGRTYRKDLTIETFREIPANLRTGVDLKDKAAIARVCEQWAEGRAKQAKVNGVYILLVKEPAHLQVLVGNDTQRAAFTLRDRDELVALMLTHLRAHRNDDALRAGVGFVATTFKSHAGPEQRNSKKQPARKAQEESGGINWIMIIVVALGAWVVIGLIRSIFGGMRGGPVGGQPGYGGGGFGGGGGGGFLSSLMGGMFGAAAGMWMYDHFLGNRVSESPVERNDFNAQDGGFFTGQDTDYSGSGGDFGDDSGGGGFGGDSDSGGFGGGSDDSNFGGGGDF